MKRPRGKTEAPPRTISEPSLTASDDTREAKLTHLKDGYQSTQEVIKFIDTKSNILIGMTTLAGGFAITLVKWALELPPVLSASWASVFAQNEEWAIYSLLLLGGSLLSFLAVVFYCLFSVLSRKATHGKLTLLFPVPRPEPLSWKQWRSDRREKRNYPSHQEQIAKAIMTLDDDAIFAEYADQLTIVGNIVSDKLNHNRWASVAAVLQLFLLACAIVIYFAIACGILE